NVSRAPMPQLLHQRRAAEIGATGMAAQRSQRINAARMVANAMRRMYASWETNALSAIYRDNPTSRMLGGSMSTTIQERPRWPVKMTRIAFFVGILAIILLVIAG